VAEHPTGGPRMRYDVSFQYLPPGAARPNEEAHKELVQHGDNDFTPIPAVGDRVAYDGTDALVTRSKSITGPPTPVASATSTHPRNCGLCTSSRTWATTPG